MSSMVLAMDRLMVAIREDGNGRVGARLLQTRLYGWTVRCCRAVVCLGLQDGTCTLPSMMTATPLFFCNSSQMCWIFLQEMVIMIARFDSLFGFP
jgi:hypothetical protein